jgi:N-acyl-D-amino-acid deacylase
VRAGAAADLVVFDPDEVRDEATWDDPRRRARGVRWVLVNGRAVVEDGTYVGGLAGHVLRARRSPDQ